MRLGAHVSAAGGLDKAIDRAREMGAETIQIFASSPRGWAFRPPPDAQVEAFRRKAAEADIGPVFLHGIYLVNLGGGAELVRKSVESLVAHMEIAGRIGAAGVIFHCGSHKGVGFEGVLSQAAAAIRQVLDRTPEETWLIIENSAGMGTHIGASFQEIRRLIEAAGGGPRLRVCLDTQHLWAAGYDMASTEGVAQMVAEFRKELGADLLVAIHANDSKVGRGSGVDRHENIGEGSIGLEGFRAILAEPAFRQVPFLLEVPGFDGKGPDRENLERLLALRSELGPGP